MKRYKKSFNYPIVHWKRKLININFRETNATQTFNQVHDGEHFVYSH